MDIFRDDVRRGRLPKVSWIVAPEAYSEHPNWQPDYGSWYVSQVIDILASNPEVWSKMALFITYDEEGGFFDHLVPPTPPQSRAQGRSTVETTNEIFAGDAGHPPAPTVWASACRCSWSRRGAGAAGSTRSCSTTRRSSVSSRRASRVTIAPI